MKTGQLYKLETRRGVPPADAHARLWSHHIEPHVHTAAGEVRRAVRAFLGLIQDRTGTEEGK